MGQPYRIVQLSDLHLTADDTDKRSEPRLMGALTGMNGRFRQVLNSRLVRSADLLLVTGDITDRGDLNSWKVFWKELVHAKLLAKVRVILGNHDIASLDTIRLVTPRATKSRDRARYMAGLRMGNARKAFPWAESLNDGAISVFALRSTIEGNVTSVVNAMGRVPKSQLQKLRKLMKEDNRASCKIVILHHPPIFPPDYGMKSFLHNIVESEANALLRLCKSHDVRLIIHGHMHMFMDQWVDDIHIVGAPASTEPVNRDEKLLHLCRYDIEDGEVEANLVSVRLST